MAKASVVVKAILGKILVRAVESELEADEIQDTIFAMNNYMTALDAEGVHLGYTVVTDLGDEITIPNGALQGLIGNVAIIMAADFGSTVDQSVIAQAKTGLSAMRKLGVTIGRQLFPSTLPIGSGNESDNWGDEWHFYPEQDETILTETGNSISLEEST